MKHLYNDDRQRRLNQIVHLLETAKQQGKAACGSSVLPKDIFEFKSSDNSAVWMQYSHITQDDQMKRYIYGKNSNNERKMYKANATIYCVFCRNGELSDTINML